MRKVKTEHSILLMIKSTKVTTFNLLRNNFILLREMIRLWCN